MPDEFLTISTTGEGYYTEKRSKFLAWAHHVETTDEVKALLADYRKRYYDARHVCSLFLVFRQPVRTPFILLRVDSRASMKRL